MNLNDLPTDDDQKLVAFLKRYQPDVPPAPEGFEAKLLASLPPRKSATRPWHWLIPGAIAVGLLGTVTYRSFNPTPQLANSAELEEFLMVSWEGGLEPAVHAATATSDPLLLLAAPLNSTD
ncbi:MAG: hypothetical protein AAGG02_16955 [Cyanobacteria bacterium P01_H01_bin.15]